MKLEGAFGPHQSIRLHYLSESLIKFRPDLLDAKLSSGLNEPLELRLVIRLPPWRAFGFMWAWAFWLAHTCVFPQSGVR